MRPRGFLSCSLRVFLFFVLFCLNLVLVDRPVRVLRRGVYGIELERLCFRAVHYIVLYPGRYYHGGAVFYRVLGPVQYRMAAPGLHAYELVDTAMNLHAYVLARLEGHHDKLAVWPGKKDLAELSVIQGLLFDIN